MRKTRAATVLLALAALTAAAGCAPSLEQRRARASVVMKSLEEGRFEEVAEEAERILDQDGGNPYASLAAAVALYKSSMHDLIGDVMTVFVGAAATGRFNQRYLMESLERGSRDLVRVDRMLEVAAGEPGISVDLCLACWEIDWNHNGTIDEFDERLMEIEQDRNERPYPKDDPRRRPTFRFDHGDVLWGRAFIAFQRASLDIARAYDWSDIGKLFRGGLFSGGSSRPPRSIHFELISPELVASGRKRILEGLDYSDMARESYLAETDDEREWLPNPEQRDHPLPLPVDGALYETWEDVIADLRRIVRGEEGLSVAELAQLGDHEWRRPPRGFIDVGRMLSEPRDIVLELEALEEMDDSSRDEDRELVEARLKEILGVYYVPRMKPSPLLRRAARMKDEVEAGAESIERKLRYLVWIN